MNILQFGDKGTFMIKIVPEFNHDDNFTPIESRNSFGKISIWVNGVNITGNVIDNVSSEYIGWYLSEFLNGF